MPKLSIVIPVYNVEKYVSKCLDSVIYPEISNYEIIIVNDGSTDSSPAICAEYANAYPDLIKLISTPNGGLGAARNVGIDNAKGDYLLFIDSDDYLSPGALPEMMECLSQQFDILFFDINMVNESGRILKYIHGCTVEGELTLEGFPELLFEVPSAWNKIYRCTLFTENRIYYPGRVWYEDMWVTPKLYSLASKMISVHRPWHNYLQRTGSITNNKNTVRNLEIIDAVDQMVSAYKAAGLFERYHDQLEYSALYNQVITSVVRVNLADPKSEIQTKLYDDFLRKFPNYSQNPYVKTMSRKYRLIMFYIKHRMFTLLNITMRMNNLIKGK